MFMKFNKADWDKIYVGNGLSKLLPQKFKYGALKTWERDLFLIVGNLLPENGSLLSVGCGRALIDYWLGIVFGAEVHLLDMSLPLLKKVHHSFGKAPHYLYHHDALELPFGDQVFDIVWNAGVWEHFSHEQIYHGIAEMARVSKNYVVVSVPYAKSRPYILAKQWLEQNGKWIYGYEDPQETLQPYFEAAGLRVIEEYPIGTAQTCWNYVNMIPDSEAREDVIKQLREEDFYVYPHVVAIGKREDMIEHI
jgi:ubiquinone/menaquinone biosynthesis C-methylase UbiE